MSLDRFENMKCCSVEYSMKGSENDGYYLRLCERHAAMLKPPPTAKATGAMRSREEWVDWLYEIAGSKASSIGPFADEILSAIAAERERAVEREKLWKEYVEWVDSNAPYAIAYVHGWRFPDDLWLKGYEYRIKLGTVTQQDHEHADAIRRLNRQRVEGTKP